MPAIAMSPNYTSLGQLRGKVEYLLELPKTMAQCTVLSKKTSHSGECSCLLRTADKATIVLSSNSGVRILFLPISVKFIPLSIRIMMKICLL
jgi:hypothetical protein